MKSTNTSPVHSSLRKNTLLALGCVFSLALVAVPALKAANSATLQPLADAAVPALPLTSSFEKVTGAEKGPFVLKLKNESHADLKVTTKVLLAVFFHGEDRARHLPEQTIKAGKTWSIADLSAEDKVVLTAEGFAPLTIVVK